MVAVLIDEFFYFRSPFREANCQAPQLVQLRSESTVGFVPNCVFGYCGTFTESLEPPSGLGDDHVNLRPCHRLPLS